MDELVLSLLDNYDLQIRKSGRCRGAVLVHCEEGIYTVREYMGSERHLEFEELLLNRLAEHRNDIFVDKIFRNREGELLTEDVYGKKYIVRAFYPARDFDTKNHTDIIAGVRLIARLHKQFHETEIEHEVLEKYFFKNHIADTLVREFQKRNQELKRIRNYIRDKNNKNEFEYLVMKSFDEFYEDALRAESMMTSGMKQYIADTLSEYDLIHGNYNYHNILFLGDGGKSFVTNFEKAKIGIQMKDMYDYFRKIMEKYKWDEKLGHTMIQEYHHIRKLSDEDICYLKMKLIYPEKYWKILNHYNNSNKYWLPDKDVQKLKKTIADRNKRISFINHINRF